MIGTWLIGEDGRLQGALALLYSSLTGIPEARLKTLIFRFNARQKNKAETWGVNRIRINPEAYPNADDPQWIGTLAHELTHEYDYYKSKLPDFIIRFFDQCGIKFRQYILRMPHEKAYQSSPLEKRAFASQKVVMDFVNKYSVQKILSNPSISESEKISLMRNLIEKESLLNCRGD
ncbi:MAG TPA: hypothetical protein PKI01_06165 [Bacteroidales bacterium]|nr:hypothetical protein [Bacteroidales bacterium]